MTPGKDAEGNDTLGTISYNSVSNRTTGTNSATNYPQGGGVWLDHGTAEVYNSINIESSIITTPGGNSANGGGVFIANGVSDSDPSTFTLQGENIAIYENLADFAADDVYANGSYTKLNVPLVIDMNLAGYGSKAEGWFEDYATCL